MTAHQLQQQKSRHLFPPALWAGSVHDGTVAIRTPLQPELQHTFGPRPPATDTSSPPALTSLNGRWLFLILRLVEPQTFASSALKLRAEPRMPCAALKVVRRRGSFRSQLSLCMSPDILTASRGTGSKKRLPWPTLCELFVPRNHWRNAEPRPFHRADTCSPGRIESGSKPAGPARTARSPK
jgi:hypothetical protein